MMPRMTPAVACAGNPTSSTSARNRTYSSVCVRTAAASSGTAIVGGRAPDALGAASVRVDVEIDRARRWRPAAPLGVDRLLRRRRDWPDAASDERHDQCDPARHLAIR